MFVDEFEQHERQIAAAQKGTTEKRRALRAAIDWAKDAVTRVGEQIDQRVREYRRRKVEWNRPVSDDEIPHAIPEQMQLARVARASGVAAIVGEIAVAIIAIFLMLQPAGFGNALTVALSALIAVFATLVIAYPFHAGISFVVKRWEDPRRSLSRIKYWFLVPALILMLLSVFAYGAIQRLSAEDVLALESVLSISKFVAMIGFVVFGAALLVIADVLGWSRPRSDEYQALCTERQRISSKQREWETELQEFDTTIASAERPIVEKAAPFPEPHNGAKPISTTVTMLLAAGLFLFSSASCARKPRQVKAEPATTHPVILTVAVDASGILNPDALRQAGENVRANMNTLIQEQGVSELGIYWFGSNGWTAEQKLKLRLPVSMKAVVASRDLGNLGKMRPDAQEALKKLEEGAQDEANERLLSEYRVNVQKVMSQLTTDILVPRPSEHSPCTDLNGALARFTSGSSSAVEIAIIVTDGRQNCHGDEIKPIPLRPDKKVLLIVVLVPGTNDTGWEDFDLRSKEFSSAVPGVVVVPFYRADLAQVIAEAFKGAEKPKPALRL
jgi:hypothetical protein